MIIRSKFVTGLFEWVFPVKGVVVFPFIFINPKYESSELILHERIHWYQWLECLIIGFPVLYVGFFLYYFFKEIRKFPRYRFKRSWMIAYRKIPFEQEAWKFDSVYYDYIKERKKYAWTGLIQKK